MRKKTFFTKVFPLALLAVIAIFTLGASASTVAAAPNTLHLTVQSAVLDPDTNTYAPITEFKYIINIDNTGTTTQRSPEDDNYACSPKLSDGTVNPDYPDSCDWVSVAGRAANSPIFTQGDQHDFPGGDLTINGKTVNVPAGRYLISVLADGYKLDGEHFTASADGADISITVKMQPYDLPTATIQAAVFEDMASTNSAPDLPGERGLAGFRAHIVDYVDEVTTDIFGNPLGAEYQRDADGNVVFDEDGAPIYIEGTGGVVLSKCYVVANGVDVGTVNPIEEPAGSPLWAGQNWPTEGRCPLDFEPEHVDENGDIVGDPLLTDPILTTLEGDPIPVGAVIEGKAIIPNVGPNRYALSVVPPDASNWIQTTTLEGNHDWDAWVMEGATGLDTEFVVAGEPFPATFFGFVRPLFTNMAPGNATISGRGLAVSAYIPPVGGIVSGEGVMGAKPKDPNPVHRLFVSLSDLNNGDQTVFIKEFPCVATVDDLCPVPEFSIPNVPDGDYVLGVWDEPQDYIFAVQNVSVVDGVSVDVGDISLLGWWTTFEGYVFHDLNGNGFREDGEPGISNFPIGMRTRENALMDRGTTGVTTDASGYYWMESAYPMTQWLIMEAYADGFHTTGISYYADNQVDANGDPIWTTIKGAGVDVNVHPVIGLGGRIDWGVQPYAPGENGGIVGTVSYDTTRNELDPSYAAIEDWQPSISNLTVELYAPLACGTHTNTPCDAAGQYELAKDGSYALGNLLNTYLTESWEQPTGCVARNLAGVPLIFGTADQQALPYDPAETGNGFQNQATRCLEAPMMGVQFGPIATDVGTPDENFGASVDGNYGFGDGCFVVNGANVTPGLFNPDDGTCIQGTFEPLPSNADYLVRVDVPDDEFGRPLYQVTREEDINVANGDSFVPQVPPSACAGALHTVDVMNFGDDDFNPVYGTGYEANGIAVGVTVPASVPVYNPPFVDMGGTIYEGQQKPLCDMKLIHLADQKSIAPGFNFFTDVPLPGRFWGLIVDDLNWSTNPKQLLYGEKMGIPFAPVGIYDYTNRLITTVESDYNGLFDVLLPSTNRISCPTPSGVCANLYRFVGNDPGTPGHWNATYTPVYRTISAEFEAFAGLTVPADLAPTQVAVSVQIPGTQTLTPIACMLEETQPQLLAVSKPYVDLSGSDLTFTIEGFGFGATAGQVLLDNTPLTVNAGDWTDGSITATVPNDNSLAGTHQLSVKADNGQTTINGLTFHVFTSVQGPVPPFPTNITLLDTFSQPGSTAPFEAHWDQDTNNAFEPYDARGTSNDYLRVKAANNSISNAWWTDSAFGADQEAYFTFMKLSGNASANQQGLLLKYTNGSSPNSPEAQWIAVVVDNNGSRDPEDATIKVYTKDSGSDPVLQLEIETPNLFFSNGDQIGARAYADGTILVYKNGSEIGSVNVPATGAWTGQIGLRFEGTGTNNNQAARVDNFGGGNTEVPGLLSNAPAIFTVGGVEACPSCAFRSIQSAIDAAATQDPYVDTLIVVYSADPDNNPRYNGRGAYYENPILYAPVQLQGVGPGGVRPDGSVVQGSIIDGIAFGGDTSLALGWLGKVTQLQYEPELNPNGGWDGNQDINDGQVIYVLASADGAPSQTRAGSFPYADSPDFKPMIDGFDIRGGDQQGLPGNLPEIFGQPPDATGAVQVETQGGAIFVNAYVNDLQITNNTIQQNGGSYGAIRIGTPNLTGPEADSQNHNLRIANNRILANGGTNLAGAIGLFHGADGYEIANNDLCGNFSAEYGGAISHFGLSDGGQIHDNRIYFNRSYDEGAGIMIAGELPGASSQLSDGSGAVDIYNNLIQANIAEDDGGGIRFLMAGNFEMNVYNNMIVNNISTHEGGGIALDDAPNVRVFNNTIMSNITTATAITSNGEPAPAGLSTGTNSVALQDTLPGGSPVFSNPLLFNNIFWNNRAGSWDGANALVTGIGAEGDNTAINYWDLGTATNDIDLTPTNSIIQQDTMTNTYALDPSNASTDPSVVTLFNIPMYFTTWRNFTNNILVTIDLPPSLLGDYHLFGNMSPAHDSGAANKTVPAYQGPPAVLNAPNGDIDNLARPADNAFDMGASELNAVAPVSPLLPPAPIEPPQLLGLLKNVGIYTPGTWLSYFKVLDKDLTTTAGSLPK